MKPCYRSRLACVDDYFNNIYKTISSKYYCRFCSIPMILRVNYVYTFPSFVAYQSSTNATERVDLQLFAKFYCRHKKCVHQTISHHPFQCFHAPYCPVSSDAECLLCPRDYGSPARPRWPVSSCEFGRSPSLRAPAAHGVSSLYLLTCTTLALC